MDNQIWTYKKLYTQFRIGVCTLKPAEELTSNAEQLSFEESIVITNVERGRMPYELFARAYKKFKFFQS
ncbi:MAG: hypothetical protein PVF96_05330 [Candidatus Bathyarchaeota archaeon]